MAEKDRKYRPRDLEIRVKVNDNEMQFAKDKADYCNLSMSELLRRFIVDGAVIKYEPIDIKELSKEINKIGVNINQIAKCVNEKGGEYDRQDIDTLISEYQNLQELIYAKIWGI